MTSTTATNPVVASSAPLNPIVEIVTNTDPLVTWLVPELIPQGSLIVLAGEAGAGKSFACYTLGMACACGIPFLSYDTTPARVLYFDQENSRPDRDQYLRWAWHGLGHPGALGHLAEHFWTRHFDLGTPDWYQRAAQAVDEVQPQLIIFDTATPCFAIVDENDNGIATQVINKLRVLQTRTTPSSSIIVLKHAKIDTDSGHRTIRGAKAWLGACDGIWFHIRRVGRPRADGLANTRIEPDKARAFGLRTPIHIQPSWTDDRHTGLALAGGSGTE